MAERIRGRRRVERNAVFLSMHPWCAHCLNAGKLVAAAEVDHIIALVNGGEDADDNLQGLCVDCHRVKTRKDLGHKPKGSDVNGMPTDPMHHWNA